jgi:hypothetical protein
MVRIEAEATDLATVLGRLISRALAQGGDDQ